MGISTPTVNTITMVAIARSFGAARVASRGFANAARQPQQSTLVAARSAFRNNAARNVIQKRGIVAESTAAAMVAAAKIQGAGLATIGLAVPVLVSERFSVVSSRV